MESFEKYNLCNSCKKLCHVEIRHSNLIYLTALIENCDQDMSKDGLFKKIQRSLLQMSTKYKNFPRRRLNNIVSKYYIYVIKHRHLIPFNSSPCFSPLKKEEVLEEFQIHLEFVIHRFNLKDGSI